MSKILAIYYPYGPCFALAGKTKGNYQENTLYLRLYIFFISKLACKSGLLGPSFRVTPVYRLMMSNKAHKNYPSNHVLIAGIILDKWLAAFSIYSALLTWSGYYKKYSHLKTLIARHTKLLREKR